MRRLRAWLIRAAGVVGRGRHDSEIVEELRAHRDLLEAEYRQAGLTEGAAHRAAVAKFGPVTSAAAAYLDRRGLPTVEGWIQDGRHAARSLWWPPARLRRSLSRVAVLAVCLVVSASLFAIVDGVLLKPLPFHDADRLFVVGPPHPLDALRPSSVDVADLQTIASAPTVAGAFGYAREFRPNHSGPAGVRESHVSEAFFDVLGVAPAMGRALGADAATGSPRAVVISHDLWRAELHGDPAIIGTVTTIGDERMLVRGVMPPGFDFPDGTTVWSAVPRSTVGFRSLVGVVRMRAGGRPAQLRISDRPVVAVRLSDYLHPGDAWSILPVVAATLLMMLITMSHLVVAQITQTIDRARETAVRAALGAGWGRITRQWWFENALQIAAAATLALALAPRALSAMVRLLPTDLTFGQPIALDHRILVLEATVALMMLSAFTLAPALVMRRINLVDLLHGRLPGVPEISTSLARHVLLGVQMAVVTGLVYVGTLALHSFTLANRADLGIDPDGLFAMDWPERSSHTPALATDTIMTRLRQMPDVIAVARGESPLVSDRNIITFTTVPARSVADLRAAPRVDIRSVSAGYFHTVGIRVLEGRDFDSVEDHTSVAILSQALARRVLPVGSVVGQDVYLGSDQPTRVVGVVSDVRVMGPEYPPRELLYTSMPGPFSSGLVIRLKKHASFPVADVRQIVGDALHSPGRIVMADEAAERQRLLTAQRARATLLGLLGLVSLGLGVAGVSATAAETVRRRLRESAIRVALGAPPGRVARQLLFRVMSVVAVGMLAGFVAGAASAYWVRSLFFGVRASDPLTIAVVAGTVAGGTLLATFVTSRRAVTADSLVLLKAD